jgi:hypothetical protein
MPGPGVMASTTVAVNMVQSDQHLSLQLQPGMYWPVTAVLPLLATKDETTTRKHRRLMGSKSFQAFEVIPVDCCTSLDFDRVQLAARWQQ